MSVLIEKISAVLEKQVALGSIASLPIPRGFDEKSLDDLPDPDKVTYRFQSRTGELRVTLFREPVDTFQWSGYLRVLEPDNPTRWDGTGGVWGPKFLEDYKVWVSPDDDRSYIAGGYEKSKNAAVFLHMRGQTEESAGRIARRMLDGLQVDETARMEWFERMDSRQLSSEETLRINKRNSREALAQFGWPVPEDREASRDKTRWDGDDLVVSGIIMSQMQGRPTDWVLKRLQMRGFGEGLSLDSSGQIRLEWRLNMATCAWSEMTERRDRQRRELLRARIEMLLNLPAAARIRRWGDERLTWGQNESGNWLAYSADRQRGYALPFSDVQHVWQFDEDGWARFSRGVQIWNDGGPRGEDWPEFRGTYHAVRTDGLILEDSFHTMDELNAALRNLPASMAPSGPPPAR